MIAKGKDLDKLADVLQDPVKFCRVLWPEITLYDKQVEILESIRDNRETFVHAGNELGKDFIAGIVAVWFFASRNPCRVVTSSSGETQLKNVLWGEINHRIATSRLDLPFRLNTLEIKRVMDNGENEPLSYIIGHVTKTVENFQGHHLPHDKPRVLYIADEASGIADEFWDAAESWFHRALVIGNPLKTTNFFFRLCKQGDKEDPGGEDNLLRKVIHIGAKHSPNVRVGEALVEKDKDFKGPFPTIIPGVCSYPEYLRRFEKWDKIKRVTRLEGYFYEGEEALVYPPEWLDLAEEAYRKIYPEGYATAHAESFNKMNPVETIGVDVASGGRDDSCWAVIGKKGLHRLKVKDTPNTMEICGITINMIKEYNLDPSQVVFDAGGGGKQVADRLREQGYNVRAVYFGEAPTPPIGKKIKRRTDKIDVAEQRQQYKNRRAEMYGILRNLMNPDLYEDRPVFALPEELYMLRQELAIMPLWYDSEGKMFLPPKDKRPGKRTNDDTEITIKKLLGRSPDRADALVLAAFGMTVRSTKRLLGAI